MWIFASDETLRNAADLAGLNLRIDGGGSNWTIGYVSGGVFVPLSATFATQADALSELVKVAEALAAIDLR